MSGQDNLDKEGSSKSEPPKICGIVRPIAAMDGYTSQHWKDVHDILNDAAKTAGYKLALVSDTDISGTIIGDIVRNLYHNEVVICDVSGRNPNVMFELGMRIAFEKPVIVIVDDQTPFSFDISAVKHIVYPRTLRYADIIEFKVKIVEALDVVVKRKAANGYLQQFGPIEVTELQSNKVGVAEIAEQVAELTKAVSALKSRSFVKFDKFVSDGQRALFSDLGLDAPLLKRHVAVSINKALSEVAKNYLHSREDVSSVRYAGASTHDRNSIYFTVTAIDSDAAMKSIVHDLSKIDPTISERDTFVDWR